MQKVITKRHLLELVDEFMSTNFSAVQVAETTDVCLEFFSEWEPDLEMIWHKG